MVTLQSPSKSTLDLCRLEHHGSYPQADFFSAETFYSAYVAGVGTGKTILLLLGAFAYAAQHPGTIQIFTEPGSLQIKDVALEKMDGADGIFRNWRGKVYERNEAGPQGGPVDVVFSNGAKLWLRAADTVSEERHRGPEIACLWMDEVALGHQEEAFDTLTARCRLKGVPLRVRVAGTPKGRNWVWQRFLAHPMADSSVFTAETMEAERAGFIPQGYTDRLAAQYGGWDAPLAQQELLASFVEMVGQVFPQFQRSVHVQSPPAGPYKAVLGGVDFGGTNPTALEVLALGASERAYGLDEWYKHGATLDETIAAIARLTVEHHVSAWICDPAGAKEIELLRRAGVQARGARHGNKIPMRVQIMGARYNVGVDHLPGFYVSPRQPMLITESEQLSWKRVKLQGKSAEFLRDEFERGQPDHAVDAATNVLAEWAAQAQPYQRPHPVKVYGEGF